MYGTYFLLIKSVGLVIFSIYYYRGDGYVHNPPGEEKVFLKNCNNLLSLYPNTIVL
jgi:hypothetical protein